MHLDGRWELTGILIRQFGRRNGKLLQKKLEFSQLETLLQVSVINVSGLE